MTSINSHYRYSRHARRPFVDRFAVRLGTVLVAWGRRAERIDGADRHGDARALDARAAQIARAGYLERAREASAFAQQRLLP